MTDEEKKFVNYWEQNRLIQKKTLRQWYVGLPAGLLFGVPIALNYALGWHKRANMFAQTHFNPMVLVVAIMLIITFIAIFSKKHQWDMNEQRYREFKAKQYNEPAKPSAENIA
jgi:hypothetical protein